MEQEKIDFNIASKLLTDRGFVKERGGLEEDKTCPEEEVEYWSFFKNNHNDHIFFLINSYEAIWTYSVYSQTDVELEESQEYDCSNLEALTYIADISFEDIMAEIQDEQMYIWQQKEYDELSIEEKKSFVFVNYNRMRYP